MPSLAYNTAPRVLEAVLDNNDYLLYDIRSLSEKLVPGLSFQPGKYLPRTTVRLPLDDGLKAARTQSHETLISIINTFARSEPNWPALRLMIVDGFSRIIHTGDPIGESEYSLTCPMGGHGKPREKCALYRQTERHMSGVVRSIIDMVNNDETEKRNMYEEMGYKYCKAHPCSADCRCLNRDVVCPNKILNANDMAYHAQLARTNPKDTTAYIKLVCSFAPCRDPKRFIPDPILPECRLLVPDEEMFKAVLPETTTSTTTEATTTSTTTTTTEAPTTTTTEAAVVETEQPRIIETIPRDIFVSQDRNDLYNPLPTPNTLRSDADPTTMITASIGALAVFIGVVLLTMFLYLRRSKRSAWRFGDSERFSILTGTVSPGLSSNRSTLNSSSSDDSVFLPSPTPKKSCLSGSVVGASPKPITLGNAVMYKLPSHNSMEEEQRVASRETSL
jgi:hypothetical protein